MAIELDILSEFCAENYWRRKSGLGLGRFCSRERSDLDLELAVKQITAGRKKEAPYEFRARAVLRL